MIHNWLKDPRFAPADHAVFLPVEIDGSAVHEPVCREIASAPPPSPMSASRVDITLSDGQRILVEGPTELTAVVSLVQGLAV